MTRKPPISPAALRQARDLVAAADPNEPPGSAGPGQVEAAIEILEGRDKTDE